MSNIYFSHLCEQISEYLKENEMTATALDRKANLAKGTTLNFLNEKASNPTLSTLINLSGSMGLSPEFFFIGSKDKSKTIRDKKKLLYSIFSFLLEKEDNINFIVAEKIFKDCVEMKKSNFDLAIAEIYYRSKLI